MGAIEDADANISVHLRTPNTADTLLDIVVLAVFVLGFAFAFGTHPNIFGDGDVSWHLAAGRWMIEHGRIPTVDPFSYTAAGKPWIAHEWLSELIMAATYNLAGYPGLALLVAASLALTFLIIGLRVRRFAGPAELCAILMVTALVLYPLTLARPLVLLWPMLALWTELLLRAREEQRLPSWWLVPLMTLWVNLHASFALGLLLVGFFGLEVLLHSRDVRKFAAWTAFGLACAAAALINPGGLTGLLLPLGAFTSSTITLIQEFKPTNFGRQPGFEIALLLILAASWTRGAKFGPARILLLLLLLHLALAHMRHQALFVIVGALVASSELARGGIRPALSEGLQIGRRSQLLLVVAGPTAFALISAIRLIWPASPPESYINPLTALRHIPASLRPQPVLNEYSLGGPLILRGIKVFMDGRTEVYGEKHFLEYIAIANGEPQAFRTAQQRSRFCWSIFPPHNKKLVNLLDNSPGWRRIYADKFAIIHALLPCKADASGLSR